MESSFEQLGWGLMPRRRPLLDFGGISCRLDGKHGVVKRETDSRA